ncbi:thiamine biosynthesis protein ThiI [Halopolyspora algeriensis]|uniref:Probable tRNA sulfurtransferase n=1 Tax=Halopolyspora algeriensis TaxID=1500506 RepID=A0A368V9U1_9ACTN|nr:tRNA uracil 4-sulfurtransferase ThiI [Halopolyspora algeriensis]RCW37483.1 thiamine biosynthesis protein ThiI [Halopolyspora algeriensis]TQM42569.1 thiamine biosynthesis protein ThiI [Halopolyspora algeriensis]
MRPQPCVLLKYGELAIKGRNRGLFERHLLRNVEHAMSDDASLRIRQRAGVLALSSRLPQQELMERARQVIGISVVQPALRVPRTPEDVAASAVRMLHERFGAGHAGSTEYSFAVRARRRNKDFPLTSEQLAAHVGQRVCDEFGWPVDLGSPRIEVMVEVDRNEVFVSVEKYSGQGGLPVGSSGRALVLLSGGFDSPVAAYRAMRRGLHCDFVHFTGAPYTGPSSSYKAYALVRQLSRFQPDMRLHVVPIGTAQRSLATAGAGQLQIVAQRRLIVRAADVLAHRLGAEALVTGDSLGQVSSQTLSNLANTESASSLPILRPLLGYDKDEVMAEARRVGTGEISALPDEDCCKLIMPPRVATRSTPEQLTRLEGRLDLDELVEKLLTNVQVLSPEELAPAS